MVFVVLMIGFLSSLNMAQVKSIRNSSIFGFYLENDVYAGTDCQYTNGFKLFWLSPDITKKHKWLLSLIKHLSFGKNKDFHYFLSLSISQKIFTPDNLKLHHLIKGDRPYAGVLCLGIGFNTQGNLEMHTLEFDMAMVGPHSYAEKFQEFVHKLIGSPYPQGWPNQLKDEFGLEISYDIKRKLLWSGSRESLGYDLIADIEGNLGNIFTGSCTGIEARLGWNLPNDFGTFLIHPGDYSKNIFDKQPRFFENSNSFGIYIFMAGYIQTALRNIFLDGNTFQKSSSVDKKPFVGNLLTGISLIIDHLKISYGIVLQTKQFITQSKRHIYGSINISYIC